MKYSVEQTNKNLNIRKNAQIYKKKTGERNFHRRSDKNIALIIYQTKNFSTNIAASIYIPIESFLYLPVSRLIST